MAIEVIRRGATDVIRRTGPRDVLRSGIGPRGPRASQRLTISLTGQVYPNELLFRYPEFERVRTWGDAESNASADAAPTVDQVFPITIDGAPAGTITFEAGETRAIVDWTNPSQPVDSVLKISAPAAPDAQLVNVSIILGEVS